MADYERLASDLVLAHDTQDQAALQRLNAHYRRSFTFDDLAAEIWRRVYAFRQRSSRVPKNYLQLAEAQTLVAQDAGYGSWAALTRGGDRPARHPSTAYADRHDGQRHRSTAAVERRRVGRSSSASCRSVASRRSTPTG